MAHPGKPSVLITGISGFTGRHLSAQLAGEGWSIAGLGSHGVRNEFVHLNTDLLQTEALANWIAEVKPTHVVHLAALSHVVGDPHAYYKINVLGTESLLEAISRAGVSVDRVLIASSANVYGNADSSPIKETTPPRPTSHYGRSKWAMEQLAQSWMDRLPISIVRPFNYTGSGQSEAFVFPKIVEAHRRRDAQINLGDLNVARDLSDVSFVCEAYRRLLQCVPPGDVINICSGRSIRIHEALQIIGEIAEFSPQVVLDPLLLRKNEIQDLRGDPSKLYQCIGELQPLSLRDILKRMFLKIDSMSSDLQV
jgi:nucleoside-diphosphate-sugar epimerase